MRHFLTDLIEAETLHVLSQKGYAKLIDQMLVHHELCFTKNGRINKSGTCRVMNWQSIQLEEALKDMKNIISPDEDFDDK